MEEQWFEIKKGADFQGIGQMFGIDPVIARIIRNRDIVEKEEIEQFLYGTPDSIPDSFLLKDMERAVDTLIAMRDKKIRIIGDYDIDGVCASYILYRGLSYLSMDVDTAIPHRMLDGYGLNDRLVNEAAEDKVTLIVTCDNGIAASKQAELAAGLGITMIITDHHEVPYIEEDADGISHKRQMLPQAEAVIDPKRDDCAYPYAGICGAFVAYHLIRALCRRLGAEDEALFDELLELTAFATIGDVMELKKENRIVVRYGLEKMRHSANTGLRALIAVCGLEGKKLSPYHIGFVLGPCMNATGRLDSAARALALLKESDEREALRLAQELKGLNDSRKDLTQKNCRYAEELLTDWDFRKEPVIVLYLPDCHESLAGIVAGRIRESYNHPVFVLTNGEEGVKGSGRSIEGYSMYDEMCACKDLFTKFGGHPMAAGLSLPEENVEEFRRRINEACTLKESDFVKKVHIDAAMPFQYVTMSLLTQMAVLEPFGNGNPRPVFAQRGLRFYSARTVGKNNRVMRFTAADETGNRFSLTYFGEHEPFDAYVTERFGTEEKDLLYMAKGSGNVCLSVTYYPECNEYQGRKEIQFVVTGFK